ncbi:hypothetical protein JM49_13510 [Pseudomonas chlororaphis subsp. aurantiaca]|uniref:hypothetical protein n=1 Tax=Pseudomonas chlororaphis TaxID=587753 RepID=UPI00050D85BF|nr:hypothetical protein [Pseudomonas chlororaphis]AIS12654.1 hypothetical protein JM49_13510 [Pseudomonas chlororaphis subsp. aurantiaca]
MPPHKPTSGADNDHPFSSVTVCFVPRAFAANTLANLKLVGTICKYGDKVFRLIETLKCDLYFPAGTFVPLDENGNIDSIHTWSDIGKLDLAFNDYLNFLMDLRRIYEGKGSRTEKIAAIDQLAQGTGRQGHAHSFFLGKHGGAEPLYDKCACRKR